MQLLLFLSADNGGPVALGKAPFLFSFRKIEFSSFRKDLLKLNLISGENSPLKEMLSLQNHLFYLNSNCQHSIDRKKLLSKVNWKTLF